MKSLDLRIQVQGLQFAFNKTGSPVFTGTSRCSGADVFNQVPGWPGNTLILALGFGTIVFVRHLEYQGFVLVHRFLHLGILH
jgi:hypothetical protein